MAKKHLAPLAGILVGILEKSKKKTKKCISTQGLKV